MGKNKKKKVKDPNSTISTLIVTINQKEHKNYHLQAKDQIGDQIEAPYILDEDITSNSILSGSAGVFYEIQNVIEDKAASKLYHAKRVNDGLPVILRCWELWDSIDFMQEARLLLYCNHPNILKGYDFRLFYNQNAKVPKFFLVLEYFPGKSILNYFNLTSPKTLPCEMIKKVIFQISHALCYLKDIIPLQNASIDILPEMIHFDGKQIKLIDLGITRRYGFINLLKPPKLEDEYPYLSTERLECKHSGYYDWVYSLGAISYQLVTGIKPYMDGYRGSSGQTLLKYLKRARSKKRLMPPNHFGDVSNDLSDLIMKMLQRKPQKRGTLEKIIEMTK